MSKDSCSGDGIGFIIDDTFIPKAATHFEFTYQSIWDRRLRLCFIDGLLQLDEIQIEFLLRGIFVFDQKQFGIAITAFKYKLITQQVNKNQTAD